MSALADWLTTVPVGEPDEDGERVLVPVALTLMTPGQIDRWAAAVNNASPEEIAKAQVLYLQHLLDEQGRELATLREAAGALVAASDALGECDATGELMSAEMYAREALRALLGDTPPRLSPVLSEEEWHLVTQALGGYCAGPPSDHRTTMAIPLRARILAALGGAS